MGKLKWILAAALGIAALAAAFVLPKGSEEEDEEEPAREKNPEGPDAAAETAGGEEEEAPAGGGQGTAYSGYVPVGCRGCGGPYPLCRDGCDAFDD